MNYTEENNERERMEAELLDHDRIKDALKDEAALATLRDTADALGLRTRFDAEIESVKAEVALVKKDLEEKQQNRDRTPKWMDFPIMERPRSLQELMAMDIPDPVVFVGDQSTPLLSEGTTVLAAAPKTGKSWFGVSLGVALATGEPFLGFPTKKCEVLYFDLEQDDRIQQMRAGKILEAKGITAPPGFHVYEKLQRVNHGFAEQIEHDLTRNPQIGVIVIDVFTRVQTDRKNTESEYVWTYRNFTAVNDLAKRHHVAFILLLHTRKQHDTDNPFDDILGSTANQAACSHMIVLFKERAKDRNIHLVAQGRGTDGIIEMQYTNKAGVLTVVNGDPEVVDELQEFLESEIRLAVVTLMEHNAKWKGRCSALIEECSRIGIGMDAGPKEIGTFLGRNVGRLQKHDGICVKTIKNGTGPRIYELMKLSGVKPTIDTIDTIDEFIDCGDENPFEPA